MNRSHVRGRMPLILVALLLLSSVIAAGVYSRSSKSQKHKKNPGTYQAETVTAAPTVISNIEGLQVTGVSLINQGSPEASLVIDVINHRDQGLIALDIVAGRGKTTSGGIGMDGSLASPPRELIPPHSLKQFTWHLGGILEGETVELAAAIFSDGKEEGERWALEGIKKSRIKFQEKQRAEKAKNGGQK